jgi:hypothetical protein
MRNTVYRNARGRHSLEKKKSDVMQVLRNSTKTMKMRKFQGIQDGDQAPQALESLRILAKDRGEIAVSAHLGVILNLHPNWRNDKPLVEHRHPLRGPEAGVSV